MVIQIVSYIKIEVVDPLVRADELIIGFFLLVKHALLDIANLLQVASKLG